MHIGVLLSGGVDSSVVLARLAEEKQHDITAYYLKIWLEDELSFLGDCPWEEDLRYARAVCEKYDVPLKIVPLQTEYHDRVVQYALKELKQGFTPSPDIFCNQMIKFGAFWDLVSSEVDIVASGHYATISKKDGAFSLVQGVDPHKDQSYFLSHLSQEQVSRCLFPLGEFTKNEVRKMADDYDLPTKDRADSQGICFLGKIKYKDFVGFHLGRREGNIIDEDSGNILGKHEGFWYHTIGQRKGLGLGGGPWFVSSKDTAKNIIYVRHESKQQLRDPRTFICGQAHWIGSQPDFDKDYELKLRHGPNKVRASISQTPQGFDVVMEKPDYGIAAGQFAVVYQGQECLGGMKILRS